MAALTPAANSQISKLTDGLKTSLKNSVLVISTPPSRITWLYDVEVDSVILQRLDSPVLRSDVEHFTPRRDSVEPAWFYN